MGNEAISALAGGLGFGVVVLWFAVLATMLIMPFALVSIARSLRAIQNELTRANDGRASDQLLR